MNVSCTSCSARYAVPDEKVRGKKVKITCKHCGTGIIVDGTKPDAFVGGVSASLVPTASVLTVAPAATTLAPEPQAAAAPAPAAPAVAPAPSDAAVPPAAPAPAAETLRFDIAYPDDRQETLSVAEVVEKYAAGTLDEEAFLWREGMPDWKAPFDIPEVASALTARGLSKKAAAPTPAAGGSPFIDDDEATRVQSSPFDDPSSSSIGEWREPGKEAPSSPEAAAFNLQARNPLPFDETPAAVSSNPASASPKPAAVSPKPAAVSPKPAAAAAKPEASKPTAARRSAARGGGDLFGDLAAAGSEEDESLGVETKDAQPKMTGARNESSVLFSLDALVKQEQKPAAKKASPKKDYDDAAILLGTDSGPSSLANLGTGSFGAALAAPDFTAPITAPLPEVRASDPVELPSEGQSKKKGGLGLLIGLGVVVLLAGGAVALGLPGKLAGTAASTPSAAPMPAPTPEAAPPPPAAEPSPPPAPDASPSATATPAPATSGGEASPAAKPTEPAKQADLAKPAADPAQPADKPADAKPADKPTEPAAPSDAPPFDKAAAVAALSAAAANAGSCKTPDGPTGSGKVSITFMPSGRATNTQVSGDLAGTAVGGCVARLFRGAKVPAFSGDAVTVSKSFSVQ